MNTLVRSSVLALALAGLSGCTDIGEGSTLKSLEIFLNPVNAVVDQAEFDEDTDTLTIHECFCANLGVQALFTDGTPANFALRVKWTSSNPDIKVYDGEDFDAFFAGNACATTQRGMGVVFAQFNDNDATDDATTERATITAEFAGIRDSVEVVAKKLASAPFIRFDDPLGVASGGPAVGVGTTIDLDAYVVIEGREREVAGNRWRLVDRSLPSTDPDFEIDTDLDSAADDAADTTALALIGSAGTVTAQNPDQGPRVEAETVFGACPGVTVAPLALRVGEVAEVVLDRYPASQIPLRTGDDPATGAVQFPLVVATDEVLRARGKLDFDDGSSDEVFQDLANFVRVRELCDTYPCASGVCDTSGASTPDQFCTNEPVCDATTIPASATRCRVEPANVLLALGGTQVTAAQAGDAPSRLVATFDPTPTNAADDPASTAPCPEALCSPLADAIRITPVAGRLLSIAIDDTATPLGPSSAYSPPAPMDGYDTVQLEVLGSFDTSLPAPADTDQSLLADFTQFVTRLSATGQIVQWTVSDSRIALVSNALLQKGQVVGQGCGGTVTVRARATGSVAASAMPVDPEADLGPSSTSCLVDDAFCDQVELTFPAANPRPSACPDPA